MEFPERPQGPASAPQPPPVPPAPSPRLTVGSGFRFGTGCIVAVIVALIVLPIVGVRGCETLIEVADTIAPEDDPVGPSSTVAASLGPTAERAARERGTRAVRSSCRYLGYKRVDIAPDYHLIRCMVDGQRRGHRRRVRVDLKCFGSCPSKRGWTVDEVKG